MSINGIFRVHGCGKTTIAFPYKPVELQLAVPLPVYIFHCRPVYDAGCIGAGSLYPVCVIERQNGKAAIGFAAGT